MNSKKRFLSIENDGLDTNVKRSQNDSTNGSILIDSTQHESDYLYAQTSSQAQTSENNEIEKFIYLSSDSEDDYTNEHIEPKDKPNKTQSEFDSNLQMLKNIFPLIDEIYLRRELERHKDTPNSLHFVCDYFSTFDQTKESKTFDSKLSPTQDDYSKLNKVKDNFDFDMIDDDSTDSQNFEDAEYLTSIFMNVNFDQALQIVKHVYKINSLNKSNRENIRSLAVDYIFTNNLDKKQLNTGLKLPTTSASNLDFEMSNEHSFGGASSLTNSDELNNDFMVITNIITDCDPDYIMDKLKSNNEPNRIEVIVNSMLEKRNYPKYKDYVKKMEMKRKVDSYLNMELNIVDFLKMYPDPVAHFYKNEKKMSENYKSHCRSYLANKFTKASKESIEAVLNDKNFHLTTSFHELEKIYDESREPKNMQNSYMNHLRYDESRGPKNIQNSYLNNRDTPSYPFYNMHPQFPEHLPNHHFYLMNDNYSYYGRKKAQETPFFYNGRTYYRVIEPRKEETYPDILDEYFFKELLFLRNEQLIKDYINEKKIDRQTKLHEAKQTNTLKDCCICYNTELLEEDLCSCNTNQHLFCKECIKTYVENNIGISKYKFGCLNPDCNSEFSLDSINEVLASNMFSCLLRNIQKEEIQKANLQNLEFCSNCDYAAIVEDQNVKVFYCLNPECLKETCRLCKEPNHLPLGCDEIEKKTEIEMRTWIENKVNESMIRVCYQCGKRFYKTDGCNMIHCECGAKICYICREPLKGYDHFKPGTKCAQFLDSAVVHEKEMKQAYENAIEEYIKLHPEDKDLKLRHDPKKIIEDMTNSNKNKLKMDHFARFNVDNHVRARDTQRDTLRDIHRRVQSNLKRMKEKRLERINPKPKVDTNLNVNLNSESDLNQNLSTNTQLFDGLNSIFDNTQPSTSGTTNTNNNMSVMDEFVDFDLSDFFKINDNEANKK